MEGGIGVVEWEDGGEGEAASCQSVEGTQFFRGRVVFMSQAEKGRNLEMDRIIMENNTLAE